MGRLEEKLLFIGYYEAVREAGSKLLVYKPGLAQLVGARPFVGERARSNFRLLSTIKKRINTSLSLLHESHQIFRFSLLVLEGKLAVSTQEVDSALMNTLLHIIPYLQITNNNKSNNNNNNNNNNNSNNSNVLFQIRYLITWNFRDTLISRISRYKRNREIKVTRKLNAALTIIKKEQVSYHWNVYKSHLLLFWWIFSVNGCCGQLTEEQWFTYKYELLVDIVRTAWFFLILTFLFL